MNSAPAGKVGENMILLPMLAFKLEGTADFIELVIDEVWGYPNKTSYGGGYGAKGKLSIRVGEYMVNSATHYFTTGELYKFMQRLQRCYDTLNGTAVLENTERELELECAFNTKGHVLINGRFQCQPGINNILTFEIRTDQTQIPHAISALHAVAEIFGSDEGVKDK